MWMLELGDLGVGEALVPPSCPLLCPTRPSPFQQLCWVAPEPGVSAGPVADLGRIS